MMKKTESAAAAQGAAASTPAIEIHGLTKSFGDVRAVRGIDLTIQPGEVVAFLGPNGAGKTTTIDMMLGLSRPDGGSVQVFGQDPRDAIGKGLVAAVMQTGGLLSDLTVRETVELTASLFVQTRSVDECLERAGIADIGDRRVGKCSGGQQQRLRFAMALVSDPALVVLDEPTTGMDVTGRREFWNAIHHDAQRGRTVLFATHYLEEADQYADRIVLVREGQIVADGTSAQIKAMASGRTVTATLAGADAHLLGAIPGAKSVDVRGDSLIIAAEDSDAVARFLFTQTSAHDIQIETRALEDAFLALTGGEGK